MVKRGSTAFMTWVMPCSRTSAATASAELASICVALNRGSSPLPTACARVGLVVVGDHDAARRSPVVSRWRRTPNRHRPRPPAESSCRAIYPEPCARLRGKSSRHSAQGDIAACRPVRRPGVAFGKRRVTAESATAASSRASGAPRQKCGPVPEGQVADRPPDRDRTASGRSNDRGIALRGGQQQHHRVALGNRRRRRWSCPRRRPGPTS